MGKRNRESDVSRKNTERIVKKKYVNVKRELGEQQQPQQQRDGCADSENINAQLINLKNQPLTNKIANVMVDEEKPIFFHKRAKLSISLLPWSLRDCKQSVENSIRKMMLKYSNGLGGILMAYSNVRLQDHEASEDGEGKGWVLNELPHIHYDVSCDVLVFFPSIGCELKGVVNECFPSHVGILVFGYINAMVSATTIREAGYEFDLDLQTWTKGGDSITSGVKINFVVTKVHECDGTISLEGDKPARSLLVDT